MGSEMCIRDRDWSVDVISPATCEDYLKLALVNGSHTNIQSVFPEHNLYLDFDEVEIGGHIWNPKLDALQAQIDVLDQTYATDVQVIQQIADSIGVAGNHADFVDAKVLVETNRASAKELELTNSLSAEATTARAAESANAVAVATEKTRAEAKELELTNSLSAEATTARAAESANEAGILVEKGLSLIHI